MDNKDLMPIEHYKNIAEVESRYWWHQARMAAAISILRPYVRSGTARLADIGCGTCGFLNQIKAALGIKQAIGLDGSEFALSLGRKYGLETQLVNFDNLLSIKDGKCDIITCMDVIEHIEDEGNFLKNIHDNLSENGMLLINAPAYNFLFSSWDEVCWHKRRYNTRYLKDLLSKNNFEVVKITYLFSFVLPIAIFRRLLGTRYTEKTCVFPNVPDFTNKALLFLGKIESAVISFAKIPFGTSVLCLAKRC